MTCSCKIHTAQPFKQYLKWGEKLELSLIVMSKHPITAFSQEIRIYNNFEQEIKHYATLMAN